MRISDWSSDVCSSDLLAKNFSKMSDVKTEKLKALQLTLDKLEKEFGKGTIMRLGDSPIVKVEAIPTGSIGLDIALGIGGFPKGRVVEIYGPESSGKTTLAIHVIAEADRKSTRLNSSH